MSFDNLCRLEAQPHLTQSPRYSDSPAFDFHVASLSSRISSLNNAVSRLSSILDQIGSRRDSEMLRLDAKKLLLETREEFKVTGESVKRAQSWKGLSVWRFPQLVSQLET